MHKISKKLSDIRIARISTVPFFIVTQLNNQINELARSGAFVTIISSYGPEVAKLCLSNKISYKLIEIKRNISPINDFITLIKLWVFFVKNRTDVVHSTTPKAGLLTSIASFLAFVPIRLHTFTGQPWVELAGFKKLIARYCDLIIGLLNTHCYADSLSQKNFLINEGVISACNLSVMGSGSLAGVDLNRFNPYHFPISRRASVRRSLNIDSDSQIILFVGRVTEDKGIIELLTAFSLIKSEGSLAHLIMVGPLEIDINGLKDRILSKLVSQPDVHMIGYSDIPELYMSTADFLCLPSYREGFGTVVIEAAAMGIPTVGTSINGLVDAIVPDVTGILVNVKDVDSLKSGLERLLFDRKLCKKMGLNARRRVQKSFDASVMNKLLVAEYIGHLRRRL